MKYANENLDLFREDNLHGRYLGEAIRALIDRKPAWARNCVEKFLLVKECSRLSTADRTQFLRRLFQEDEVTIEKFDLRFDRTMQYCREEAEDRQSNPVEKRRERPPPIAGRRMEEARRHEPETSTSKEKGRELSQPPPPSLRRHEQDARSEGSEDEVPELGRKLSQLTYPTVRGDRTSSQERPLADVQSRHGVNSSVRSIEDDGSHWTETELKQAPSFRGSKGPRAKLDDHLTLDPAYRKLEPRPAGDFFKVGKVFAIVDHQEDNRPPRSTSSDVWSTKTTSGLFILSHVRRFIVVKEGHGFCWSVGINTYGGQGVRKRGFNKKDQDAHAIAYTSDSKPIRLPDEPKLLKDPIEINPVSRAGKVERLDAASRIDFARVRTVEHNVRVKHVGEVARKSLPYLRSYWSKHKDE